jgi:hypothetical protein
MTLLKSSLIVMAIALGLELAAPEGHGALLVDVDAVRAPSSTEGARSTTATPAEPALHASARAAQRQGRWAM